ncbi:hypothetical protein K0817_016210 [Microbacterium sp. HD4P20]|nr:hypothetical protein [Microbacterium sp. HD4P20]
MSVALSALESPFVADLVDALGRPQPRVAMRARARRFLDGASLEARLRAIENTRDYTRLRRHLIDDRPESAAESTQIVEDVLGLSPVVLANDGEFNDDEAFLRDALIALKLAEPSRRVPLERVSSILRTMELIRRLADDGTDAAASPITVLTAPIALPPELFPPQEPEDVQPPPDPEEDAPTAASFDARSRRIDRAALEIASMAGYGLTVARAQPTEPQPRSTAATGPTGATGATGATALTSAIAGGPQRTTRDVIVLADSARSQLSAESLALFDELRIDPASSPIGELVTRLEAEQLLVAQNFAEAVGLDLTPPRLRVSSSTIPAHGTSSPLGPAVLSDPSSGPPDTVGPLRPLGVGDLLVTRQQIKRYEAGEISHVENVMRTETRSRETRRLQRSEETFVIEREETQEHERDLQTTDRNEVQTEMEQTLKEDKRFSLGTSISAGYGPFVQVEATTGYETSTSTEQTNALVSTVAKEVVDRTVQKLSTRVRTEQTRKTIEEFEEKNSHGFDNTEGTEHAIGIYQWLDRVYEMQLYNYGLRVLFECVVPEPSALLLRAIESQIAQTEGIAAPPALTIKPSDLTRGNYAAYVKRHAAEGVAPPPGYAQRIGHTFAFTPEEGSAGVHTDEVLLAVPEGYKATSCQVDIASYGPLGEPHDVIVSVAERTLFRRVTDAGGDEGDIDSDYTDTLPGIAGEIPVTVAANNVTLFTATVTIDCVFTWHSFERWQLETYDALQRGFAEQRSRYEEKLAVLAAEEDIVPTGRNPGINRQLEHQEIKRLCTSMLTGQHFANTGVALSPQAAEFNFTAAMDAGRYAAFWEKCIDWPNLEWRLLPYFWTTRDSWARMLFEDTDPLHALFVSAGAALVRFAVAPGYEAAVLHFLEGNGIWDGGDPPEVVSDDYVALLDEITASREPVAGATDLRLPSTIGLAETPVGEPWEVRIPTTLVRLRPDHTLPEWVKGDDGRWLPVD